jgi:hypothetical protein
VGQGWLIAAETGGVGFVLFDVRLDTVADLGILHTVPTEGVAGDIAPKQIELVALDQDRLLPWRSTRPTAQVGLLMLTNPRLKALLLVGLGQVRNLNPFRFLLPGVLACHSRSSPMSIE